MAVETFAEKRTRVGSFWKALVTPSMVYFAEPDTKALQAVKRAPRTSRSGLGGIDIPLGGVASPLGGIPGAETPEHPWDAVFDEDGFRIFIENPDHPNHDDWLNAYPPY